MVTEEADGAGRHTGALLVGFSDVALIVCEDTPKVLVAEPTDNKTWIGDGVEESEVFSGGLERTDTTSTSSFTLCDCVEDRLEGLRGSS